MSVFFFLSVKILSAMFESLSPSAVHGFACLQLLDLAGCGLDEWSQVSAFGSLSALKELRIDENPIQVLEWCSRGLYLRA